MDTATTHPEMVRVPARGRDTRQASVIWRRDGMVRVELWTRPSWNYASRPSGTCRTLPEAEVIAEAPASDSFVLRIDGDHATTLAAFIADNADDIEPRDIALLRALVVGELLTFHGGAFADMQIERLS